MKNINLLKVIAFIMAVVMCAGCSDTNNTPNQNQTTEIMYDDIPAEVEIGGVMYSTESTELNLSWSFLTDEDIVNLKYMVNLTQLDLGYNQISDISPLAGLTNLT